MGDTVIVTTQTATYEVAPDRTWIVRYPAGEPPRGWTAADLRKDSERIPVLHWTEPVVGEQWRLILDVRGDGIQTIRTTTPVQAVTE